jgi:hypothetical protein
VDQENKYISQNSAEGLPPGAPSVTEAWYAMVQLLDKEMPSLKMLDKEMPSLKKSKKQYFILLILIPLFVAWPPASHDAVKQKVFLTKAGRPLNIARVPYTNFLKDDNTLSVVRAREILKKQTTTTEEIEIAQTRNLQDTGLKQNGLQQIRFKDRDSSMIIKTPEKKDQDDKKESSEEDATDLEIQTGLSWSLPMPLGGGQNYFAGPSGATQPYRYALPGAWISMRADNYLFTVSMNPFASSMVQPAVIDSSVTVPDSVTRIVKSNEVTKLFGIVATLHIDHRIGGNWWAGGGLQGNWWQEAVNTVYEKIEKSPVTGAGSMRYMTSTAAVSDSSWKNLSRFQIFLNGELIYRTASWQAGVEAGFSVTPLANYGNPRNLFNAAVFFRLPIITKNLPAVKDDHRNKNDGITHDLQ